MGKQWKMRAVMVWLSLGVLKYLYTLPWVTA